MTTIFIGKTEFEIEKLDNEDAPYRLTPINNKRAKTRLLTRNVPNPKMLFSIYEHEWGLPKNEWFKEEQDGTLRLVR